MRILLLRRGLLAVGLLLAGLAAAPAWAQGGGGGANDPSFNVVNRSGRTIQELYVSSAQQNAWGADMLGQNVLDNGRSFPVRLPAGQCVNDIRVVYAGGQSEERRAVDTCPLSEVVFGQQAGAPRSGKGGSAAAGATGNPSFNLVNRTRKTIQVLRASPSSESNWGDDRLGDAVVRPGATFAVRLPAGECTYDVRVEYDDRSAEERRGLDLCRVADVTFP